MIASRRARAVRRLATAAVAVIFAGLAWGAAGSVAVTRGPGSDYIIVVRDAARVGEIVASEAGRGTPIVDVFSGGVPGFVAELDDRDVQRLLRDSRVLLVERDTPISLSQPVETSDEVDGSYIVVLRPTMGASEVLAVADAEQSAGSNVTAVYTRVLNGFAAELSAESLARLSGDPVVESIERDQVASVSVESFATQTSPPWGLDRIDQRALPLDSTFTHAQTGSGVKVYVVDTGIYAAHSDFGARVESGATWILDGVGTEDCNGHGTHVAGIIGGATYGVAKSATLVPIRVLDCAGSGTYSNIIAALDWVRAQHRAGDRSVVNMSLGGGVSGALNTAVANLVADGVVVVASAGNSNADACNRSPAGEPTAITVGSTTSTDARAATSNFGTCLDIFAPGAEIASTWRTGPTATATASGTSMAAPHVAGAAALLLQADGSTTPDAVAERLMSMASLGVVTSAGTGSPNRLLFVSSDLLPANPTVPGAPRSVSVSAGDRSVFVSWLAPLDDGGRAIVEYVVTATPGGATCTTAGLTSCAVAGLANGTSYTFAVAARNSAGVGSSSTPSTAVTPVSGSVARVPTSLWGLDRIDQRALPLDGLASRRGTGAGVRAYIVDTGVRATHREFGSRMADGFTAIADGRGTNDCDGHGTHVAGTVAGSSFGVAPDALVVPVRVLDCNGSGTVTSVVSGLDWIIANHPAATPGVVNMSLGGSASATLDLAVRNLVGAGLIVVVAAGNENKDACLVSPAREPLAITVGATGDGDARASYSNFGTCVDLFAPGSGVLSGWYTADTASATLSGTSMAAPHVAGVVAAALERAPNASPADVAGWLGRTATTGRVTSAGSGSPDLLVYALLDDELPGPDGTTTSTTTTSTTTPTTTTSTTTTTTVPSGGSSPRTTTTTSTSTSSVPPTSTTLPPTGNARPQSPVTPELGSRVPDLSTAQPLPRPSITVRGGSIVLGVRAPQRATVHVYRNGRLVSSLPGAAAGSIRVRPVAGGSTAIQVVVVRPNGRVQATPRTTVRTARAAR